ncbi:endospore germination permease [Thalassorhabdus alkalitolerans]|uniref:Endospore germination permease n=1 Tax=Thalassorhabdus alkalitolerans TaxID=2282697 RepID=A0ABW0YN71_9BACI
MLREKLQVFHVILLTYMLQTGVVLFSLPRLVEENLGPNGWIGLLAVFLIAIANAWLIALVFQRGKGKSVFEILESVSKWLAYPIYVYLILVWAFLGCLVDAQFVFIFQMISFPTTSPWVFKVTILMLVVLYVHTKAYSMVKAASMLFFLSIWTLVVLVFPMQEFDWGRTEPLLFHSNIANVEGVLEVYPAFLGFELILLLFPLMYKKFRLFQALVLGNLFSLFVYMATTIVSLGFFGSQYIGEIMFPVLDLIGYVRLPFVERAEALIFSFFIGKVVVTVGFYYWAAKEALERIYKPRRPTWLVVFLIIGTYIPVRMLDTFHQIQEHLALVALHATVISFGLPILLLIILSFKKPGRSVQKG